MHSNLKLAQEWMDAIRHKTSGTSPRNYVEKVILEAFTAGYNELSDGCTAVSDLGWPIPYPPCVGHDWLYFTGKYSRAEADEWLKDAQEDFGMTSIRANLRYFGTRLFSWKAWRDHRKKKEKDPLYGTERWIVEERERRRRSENSKKS